MDGEPRTSAVQLNNTQEDENTKIINPLFYGSRIEWLPYRR